MKSFLPSNPSCGAVAPLAAGLLLLGLAAAKAADYPTTVLADKPFAYFRMEEDAGTVTLTDSSGNGVVATNYYSGTRSELGHLGLLSKSLHFDGTIPTGTSAGAVVLPWRQELAPTNASGTLVAYGAPKSGPFTIECWARSMRTSSSYEGLVSVTTSYNSSDPNGNWEGWTLGKSPNGGTKWIMSARNGGDLTGGGPITLGAWYHLVATYDGNKMWFYVNTNLVQSSTMSGFIPDSTYTTTNGFTRTANNAIIGAAPYAGSSYIGFSGEIDEVAFYTNSLTAAQIRAHYIVGTNSFGAPPQPPSFIVPVASQTAYAGTPVTFRAQAAGDLPIAYQWSRGGTEIANATNSSYTFTCSPADDGASFTVKLTNSVGVTNSDPATLTVSTELLVAGDYYTGAALDSIIRYTGSYAAFRPLAYGAQPITYQWYKDGALLAGQTRATLWLTNVQAGDAGTYSVQISNPWQTTSPEATLAVQDRPAAFTPTGYAALVAADHPVAYWQMDDFGGGAADSVGTFDGSLTDLSTGGTGVFTYQLPTGIPYQTNFSLGLSNGAVVSVPFAVELSPETTWSAETWVQPGVVSSGPENYVVLSTQYSHSRNVSGDWNGWYLYHGSSRMFSLALLPANSILSAGPRDPAHNNQIVAGQWYHVVVSCDATNYNLFINGELRASRAVAGTAFIPNGSGVRPEDGFRGSAPFLIGQIYDKTRAPLAGAVDDTALYNYALTPQQVQIHYTGTAKLTLAQTDGKVVLSWPVGTLQSAPTLTGSYNDVPGATSPYTNAMSGASRFYRLKVQ